MREHYKTLQWAKRNPGRATLVALAVCVGLVAVGFLNSYGSGLAEDVRAKPNNLASGQSLASNAVGTQPSPNSQSSSAPQTGSISDVTPPCKSTVVSLSDSIDSRVSHIRGIGVDCGVVANRNKGVSIENVYVEPNKRASARSKE